MITCQIVTIFGAIVLMLVIILIYFQKVKKGLARSEDRFSQRAESVLLEKNRLLVLLSEFARMCLELPFAVVDYSMIAGQLLKITGAKAVFIKSCDQIAREAKIEAHAGEGELVSLIGSNIVGSTWKIDNNSWELIKSGKLNEIEGVYDLSFGNIPRESCIQIESSLEIGSIYGLGLVHQLQVLGCVVVIMPTGRKLAETGILEIFTTIAATTILRKVTEEKLYKSNEKLESSVRELKSAQTELEKNYEEIVNLSLYDT
ncbi:MAG: hypothetical protein ACYDEQ_07560, partial [Desulfocucumaceae bacterium]